MKFGIVDRGRWVMHDGMQYDPIQGQSHKPFKVGNLTVYNGSWQLTTNSETMSHYLNLFRTSGRIFDISPSFYVTWLWTWHKRQLQRVDRQSRTGLIYVNIVVRLLWRGSVSRGINSVSVFLVFQMFDYVFMLQASFSTFDICSVRVLGLQTAVIFDVLAMCPSAPSAVCV